MVKYSNDAVVAQSAERRTRNAQVKGSTPFNGSKKGLRVAETLFCLQSQLHLAGEGVNIKIGATDNDPNPPPAQTLAQRSPQRRGRRGAGRLNR